MKTLIITGASRGIGAAAAMLLAKDYEYIAIVSKNNSDRLAAVAHAITQTDCLCHAFTGDVSEFSFVKAMVQEVYTETGSIDTLINNAGISNIGLFTDTTPEQWQEMLSVNLTSIYNTCHEVVPHMVSRKSGQILNISSVWGLVGASCEVAYSATKGAVNSFTKALSKELAPSNISINAIAFGVIDTDMNRHLDAEERVILENEIPYGKMATPEEAAMCIRNIINMPSYLTGEIIKFDGGWI
ncbi:MAG: SDR family NAD(P)-dependent oxidoreductase [Wujia sp.]